MGGRPLADVTPTFRQSLYDVGPIIASSSALRRLVDWGVLIIAILTVLILGSPISLYYRPSTIMTTIMHVSTFFVI